MESEKSRSGGKERERGGKIQELVDTFRRLFRDGLSMLALPWLAIAAVDLVFVGISIAVILAVGAEVGRGGYGLVQFIGIIQAIVVLTLRIALLSVLREMAFKGPTAVTSYSEVLRLSGHRLGASLGITVVFGIALTVGLALCVLPGLLVLFFFAFAPFLVAAKGLGVFESLGESARWAQREWALLVTAFAVAFVALAGLACVTGVITAIGGQTVLAITFGLAGGWVVNTILGYLAFLWWGSVYVIAEEREQLYNLEASKPSTEVPPAPSS